MWRPRTKVQRNWQWCRVYHQDSSRNPNGHSPREFGPLYRFDPHRPDVDGNPAEDADHRSILYVGSNLTTSACEVFGETREAALCPAWRVALLEPSHILRLYDLTREGSAMRIGALPSLADGPVARALSQMWARAIFEDQPAGGSIEGIRYRSGYNAGTAVALWNSAGKVRTLRDAGADLAMTTPGILARVTPALNERHIVVRLISSDNCTRCP